MKKLITISIVLSLAHQCTAQYITQENNQFGLVSAPGKILIENRYDAIRPLDSDKEIYVCTQNGKKKLYDMRNSQFYPFVFDELEYEAGGYKLRAGNLYGYITESGRTYSQGVFEPMYTYVEFTGSNKYVSLGKDSVYGLVENNAQARQVIPFMFDSPIYASDYRGFYCYENSLLRQDTTGQWRKVELSGDLNFSDGLIVVTQFQQLAVGKHGYTSSYTRQIAIYDNKTGEPLSLFANTDLDQLEYSRFKLIRRIKHMKNKKQVTLYNPYTGSQIISMVLSDKAELYCINGDSTEPGKMEIIQSTFSGTKHTVIGSVQNYAYVPYNEPEVTVVRSTRGGGGGNKAGRLFFWTWQ